MAEEKQKCNHCHKNANIQVWIYTDHWNDGVLFCFDCHLFSFFRIQANERNLFISDTKEQAISKEPILKDKKCETCEHLPMCLPPRTGEMPNICRSNKHYFYINLKGWLGRKR